MLCKGERQPNSKLTEDLVRTIRMRAANGEPQRSIAIDSGVSQHTVYMIVNRYAWKHVT